MRVKNAESPTAMGHIGNQKGGKDGRRDEGWTVEPQLVPAPKPGTEVQRLRSERRGMMAYERPRDRERESDLRDTERERWKRPHVDRQHNDEAGATLRYGRDIAITPLGSTAYPSHCTSGLRRDLERARRAVVVAVGLVFMVSIRALCVRNAAKSRVTYFNVPHRNPKVSQNSGSPK